MKKQLIIGLVSSLILGWCYYQPVKHDALDKMPQNETVTWTIVQNKDHNLSMISPDQSDQNGSWKTLSKKYWFEVKTDPNGFKKVYFVWYFVAPIVINNVDFNSFKILNSRYAKDKNHVYSPGPNGEIAIEWANPGTFEVILGNNDYWGKDKNFVFGGWSKVDGADPKSFQIINESYEKDNASVFSIVTGKMRIDPKTFTIIDSKFIKDTKNVYFSEANYIAKVDLNSFQALKTGVWYKDNHNVYSYTTSWWISTEKVFVMLSGVNPKSE